MAFSSVLGASSVVKPGVVTTATRPSSPFVGQLIYDTTLSQTLAYNGSAWVVQTGGLVLISTTTIGSAVSSTSLSAGTFSSAYTNYKILFTGVTSTSANITVTLRLRSASTDEGGAAYSFGGSAYAGSLVGSAATNQTSLTVGFIRSGFAERTFINTELYGPQVSNVTAFALNNFGDNAGTFTTVAVNGILNTTTSYDSLSFLYSGGTVTGGAISVYGYAKG